MPIMVALGSSSIILSAVFTIYLYNRVAFGVIYSLHLKSFTDLNQREYTILLFLFGIIVVLGIYPAIILDGLHYFVSTLIYSVDSEHLMLFLLIGKLNQKHFINNKLFVKIIVSTKNLPMTYHYNQSLFQVSQMQKGAFYF